MLRRVTCGAVVAAAAGLAATPAAAWGLPATGERATVDVILTTTKPGTATGVTYRSQIRHPTDPAAEPIALRRLIVGTPAGGVVDTGLPERCTASDEELRMRGEGVCPPGSIVGTGFAELAVTGLGRQRFDTTAFNETGQQVETVRQGRTVSAVVRGYFTAEGLDALIPTCITGGQPPQGCPDDQARLRASELITPVIERDGRAYFRTPPTCPPSGRWSSPVVLVYADGVTERLFPEQPCDPPAPPKECRSRRQVVLEDLVRRRLRSITARYRGRRVRLDPRRPVVDLRGLRRGRYTVRITAKRRDGTRVRIVRRYRTCAPRSPA